jgi:hypothetical protein
VVASSAPIIKRDGYRGGHRCPPTLLPRLQNGAVGRSDGLHECAHRKQVAGRRQLANVTVWSRVTIGSGRSLETVEASDVDVERGYQMIERL